MSWFRAEGGDWILHVHAQPGAKRTEVSGLHGDALKIRVSAPALEDRANEALVAFLAECFKVPKRQVVLEQGSRGREKRFRVRGSAVTPDTLLPR